MTYYISLQDTLIFFCIENKEGFKTIRQIAETIKESSVEEARKLVIDFLIENEITLGCYNEKTGKFHAENSSNKNI